MTNQNNFSKRAKDFLNCLGNGRSIIEIEQEESLEGVADDQKNE